ncbi:apolipoprotein N-acyltransferase [Rhodospira trueperi]|uniref:Apolipoprotein N-acyltransferase n=1 Tax=Rhodospira trueperi TaxID=69960 RepID=A0A1G6XU65_9PROT|nr:apolipoprotein N-acyltransferase [Rhodospira trueperi]SDD80937.1 apolipoprotein N-acyltransferase [Rhodospira trueperi]
MIARLAAGTARLRGTRRHATACLLGMGATLALPPIHALPMLVVALIGLVWLLDGVERRARGAFAVGWWFGLGHFVTGLYWIANALLIEADRFGWMVPFAILGLSAFLALFTGAATLLAGMVWHPGRPWRILPLAAAWLLGEWLRTWVATGFPWNMTATVWMPVLPVLQIASVIGALGLGGLTVLALSAPAVLADPVPRRRKAAVLSAAALVLLIPAGWGFWRLSSVEPGTVPDVRLRLVQPALTQAEKLEPAMREVNLLDHVVMTRGRPGFDTVTAVIWPETAAAFALNVDTRRRRLAGDGAPAGGVLMTGAPRVTPLGVEPFRAWNSFYVLDAGGGIVAVQDKFHLVPFGEYVPFGDILPLDKVTPGSVDFSFGRGPRTLRVPGLPPVSPLICYEVIFPGQVIDRADRPDWMVNITNDGWYGISSGPFQHFATARLRAIEEGLPLARVANTGISAMIDPLGRVTARLGLGQRDSVDTALPEPLPPTPFARLGQALPIFGSLVIILAALAFHRSARAH